jgi:hypothetical protein
VIWQPTSNAEGSAEAVAARRAARRRALIHGVFGTVVAVLTVVWAGQRATAGVRNNLDTQLRNAGGGANAAMVALESEQLTLLRAVTFTQGFASAMAASNVPALDRLVTPLQANSGIPMVDVVRKDGIVEFAVRSAGAPRPVASRAGMPAINQSLVEAKGPRGGRFTEIVVFRSGPVVMTVGPVLNGNTPAGVVLVMTPLADALGRMAEQVGANLTAYDPNGVGLATSASFDPPPLPTSEAGALMAGAPIAVRYIQDGNREELGRLIIDHQPNVVLGVALVDNSAATGRMVSLYVGVGMAAALIALATLWARTEAARGDDERRAA